MDIVTYTNHHLVKSEDLNHHGTLYAGRAAEWFVEAGFVAAAGLVPPKQIVCLKIHGMMFMHPVLPGEIVHFRSKIVATGKSRLVAFIEMGCNNHDVVKGFITFINVDPEGHAFPHGITLTAISDEDRALNEEGARLMETTG
ncbi:MAG: acyl-CoA thioesterase [Chloroflexi bacterium]|nr:acyl-CoA thioesterase [Chloroflexota bacterium]